MLNNMEETNYCAPGEAFQNNPIYSSSGNNNPNENTSILHWRNKVSHDKKCSALKEIRKFDMDVKSLEREKAAQLYNKHSSFYDDLGKLLEVENVQIEERHLEKEKLKSNLYKIKDLVQKFQKDVNNKKLTTAFIEKLKDQLQSVESAITTFKETQRHQYESLVKDELSLTHEVATLQSKFNSWNQIVSHNANDSKNSARTSACDSSKNLPEDVAIFEKFVQRTGGNRGGWDEYDHVTFLKLWSRYKNKVSNMLEQLRMDLPTKDEAEIREHVSWYREYLQLEANKKEAILKWRQDRQIDRDLKMETCDENLLKENLRPTRKELQCAKERKERFSRLNAWKVQKELEQKLEEEKKLKETIEKKQMEIEERKKQLDTKTKVLEYRRLKDEEEAAVNEQRAAWVKQEEDWRRQLSAREISRFHERDRMKLNSVTEHKKKLVEEKEKRSKNLEKLKQEVVVERDPSRILRPTKGWTSKVQDKTREQVSNIHLPHRAVPSWRLNIK